jgi:glycosyltransferase involved in cell wall biosynthesis
VKVLHVIVGLNLGGAETMLKRLIESNQGNNSSDIVVSLTSLGEIGELLQTKGVPVHALGMSSSLDFFRALWKLIKLIHLYNPTIVQTWMYHADLIGGIAAKLAGSYPIVWGVHSIAIPQGKRSITYWIVRLCALLSYFIPNRIICCAESAKLAHTKLKYSKHKLIVIPNGYNFLDFYFDINSRNRIRSEFKLNESDILIGVVGRFDPLKDFHNFVFAASLLSSKISNVKFLMVGRGNEWSNTTLSDWIISYGLVNHFYLLGQQYDPASFLSAMDIFCLSSASEAFPNVVVEAMAVGLPCVVTRAGDAAIILNDEDFIVPIKDSQYLAKILLKMCLLDPVDRKSLGEKNVKKVRDAYKIESIRKKYDDVYYEIIMVKK